MFKRIIVLSGLLLAPAAAPFAAMAADAPPTSDLPPDTSTTPVPTNAPAVPQASTPDSSPVESDPPKDVPETTSPDASAPTSPPPIKEDVTEAATPPTTVAPPSITIPPAPPAPNLVPTPQDPTAPTPPDLTTGVTTPEATPVATSTTVAPDTTTPAPTDPGLTIAAVGYDSIYANGLPVGIAMATSRQIESGNNYTAQNKYASASGAYQIIDMFWNNYGGYPRAYLAPPQVQDQFAYEAFVRILKANGDNVAAIPVSWYYPAALTNPALMDTIPMEASGNKLTIREYQTRWLTTFYELLQQGSPPFLPTETDPMIPAIAFPVLGPVQFTHDFGHPRGTDGERSHEGLDFLGRAGQPLRAAFDGTITRLQPEAHGIAGVVVTVTRTDGVRANYFHGNDDTPGTTDNSADPGLRVHPGLKIGDTVKAGQIIGYMGDTGNAVGIPHLHFELRTFDGVPIDPYPSALAAQQREQCSVGIGPWSTSFVSPDEVQTFLAATAMLAAEEQYAMVTAARAAEALPPQPVYTIAVGPDGDRWEIDAAGNVRASGVAAMIQPGSGACATVPMNDWLYGAGASGVGEELLPLDWWNVGIAYAGIVIDDDLNQGDGVAVDDQEPGRTTGRTTQVAV